MKRAIKINDTDTELDIGAYTTLKVPERLFWLEEFPNKKTWRLTHTYGLIPDLTKVSEFRFKHGTKQTKSGTVTTLEAVELIDKEGAVIDTWEIETVIPIPATAGDRFITFDAKFNNTLGKETWRVRYYTNLIPSIVQCTGFTVVRED